MKFSFFLIFILAIIGLAFFGYLKSTPGAKESPEDFPKIEITPQFFDFGEVIYGQVAEYNFKVKNSGRGVLEIKRVATSCSCTKGEIASKTIMPGQEADLHVSYDTGAMSGPHGKGSQERIIYVQSSDPINPQVEVKIYATVSN